MTPSEQIQSGINRINAHIAQSKEFMKTETLVPCCEGCGKPLVSPNAAFFLLIKDGPHGEQRQAVFCEVCASDIMETNREP